MAEAEGPEASRELVTAFADSVRAWRNQQPVEETMASRNQLVKADGDARDAADALAEQAPVADPMELLAQDRAREHRVEVSVDFNKARLWPEDPRIIVIRCGRQQMYLSPAQMDGVVIDGVVAADAGHAELARVNGG